MVHEAGAGAAVALNENNSNKMLIPEVLTVEVVMHGVLVQVSRYEEILCIGRCRMTHPRRAVTCKQIPVP